MELMSARERTTPVSFLLRQLLSVNAKQLKQPALQAGPSRCESGHGCHFALNGVISSARRSAKAEVRGANPRESANFKAPVPQQLQGEFRKLVFVGASPTRGSSFNGDHDVTAASRPVKAFVPVRIRLVTPISMGRS